MNIEILKSLIRANPTIHRIVSKSLDKLLDREKNRLAGCLCLINEKMKSPVFVKVGANDGITGDPCEDFFLKNTKWRGILIEPVPYCVEKLKQNYFDTDRFKIEQSAIGEKQGTTTFYYVSKNAKEELADLPEWYDQLGSFDREHIVKHLDGRLENYIVSIELRVETLDSILIKHQVKTIDFLHIDTEGYDLHVLKSIDLKKFSPLAICIEHKHLSKSQKLEMRTTLEQNEFIISELESDYFAVNSKIRKMMSYRNLLS